MKNGKDKVLYFKRVNIQENIQVIVFTDLINKDTTTELDVTKFTKCFEITQETSSYLVGNGFGFTYPSENKNKKSGKPPPKGMPIFDKGQNELKAENIGDGICHDYLNRPDCGFDGGDCCLKGSVANCLIIWKLQKEFHSKN